ncbi:CbtA family protein [Candidatus Spongiihabitans sp.]|uniref:CbtA family protein n=1 Tax=Candidatus Spongiihabitans sp. TaxID=3101308 RepID=UPI003C6FA2FF
MTFRNIVFSALVAGIIAGSLYGLFQQLKINPIIYAAEVYEVSEYQNQDRDDAHSSDYASWAPADRRQRILSTLGANILIGIGLSLLLICAMSLHNLKSSKPKVNGKTGIIWGIGLMAAMFVAPSLLGLQPEIPGALAQPLEHRQIGWIAATTATAAGLLIVYYGGRLVKLLGIIMIALPHFIALPFIPISTPIHGYANSDPSAVAALNELSHQFVIMSSIGMLIFCILLGSLSGFISTRFVRFD